jgi:hypothetical protein
VVSVMGIRLERDSMGTFWALVAFVGALLAAIAAGGYAGWRYYSARRVAGASAPGAAPGR